MQFERNQPSTHKLVYLYFIFVFLLPVSALPFQFKISVFILIFSKLILSVIEEDEIPNCNCGFIYFCTSLGFGFIFFEALLLGAYTFKVITSL